jgi:hypothetical protein
MASIRDHDHNVFMPQQQLPHWSQLEHRGAGASEDASRPPMVHPEPPQSIELGEPQSISRSFPCGPPVENVQIAHSQQLPGVQELLSSFVHTGAGSPVLENWALGNNTSAWRDRLLPTAGGLAHGTLHTAPTAFESVQLPPYLHETETPMSEKHSQGGARLPMGTILQRLPSMPMLSLRQPGLSNPTTHSRQDHPLSAGVFHLQIAGQRDILGEGLCYVFKDGSTCPTVIDGEPVNPLWGTTKAGKARKRLAQACLYELCLPCFWDANIVP